MTDDRLNNLPLVEPTDEPLEQSDDELGPSGRLNLGPSYTTLALPEPLTAAETELTIHSWVPWFPRNKPDKSLIDSLESLGIRAHIVPVKRRGYGYLWGYLVPMHFSPPDNPLGLLPSAEVEALIDQALRLHPILRTPATNRIDLAYNARSMVPGLCDYAEQVAWPSAWHSRPYRPKGQMETVGDALYIYPCRLPRPRTGITRPSFKAGANNRTLAIYSIAEKLLDRHPELITPELLAWAEGLYRVETRFYGPPLKRLCHCKKGESATWPRLRPYLSELREKKVWAMLRRYAKANVLAVPSL
jgi:hypothetical protein